MKAIQILRTADGASEELMGAVVARLAERGIVGTVTDQPSDAGSDRAAASGAAGPADVTYTVGPDGWTGAGVESSVGEALDRLAPTCEYGLVHATAETRLPTVAIGESAGDGDRHLAAGPVADLRPAAIVEAIEEVDHYETLESLVAAVKQSSDAELAGAISTFTGRVRAKEHPEDERTHHLEFERYDEPAKEQMATIAADLEAREGVYDVRVYHKTGVVEAGEDIVHVVVLAGHRPEAFAAVADGIDRLKAEVPLFKKEVTDSEEFWAHERPATDTE